MLLTSVHLGHVLDCIFHLFIGSVERRRQSAWLRGFCELAQSLLASAHSMQYSAPSLQCKLSHCIYCKWCWFTEILKLLLETELPHTVWLAQGSLGDWAKKGGWGWNCFEMNPVYVFTAQECCVTSVVMGCVCRLASTSENFAWHTGNQEEYSSVYRYLPALQQCWDFINICRMSLIKVQTKYY